MQKGSESVSLSRTTCSSTTATPSPLKNLDWWDWEETKKQIQSKAASKAQTTSRSSSRRSQARSHQPVVSVGDGVQSEATYSSPLPVIFQRIPSDDVHPKKCFDSSVEQTVRSRPNIGTASKRDHMMSLRKLLSFSSKVTVTTPSVATAQSAPGLPSVHRLTWEDDDETPLSVGRKWNLATLPGSTTPTTVSTRRSFNESSNSKKNWNKPKLPTSTLSSTESEDIDDGQLSGSSSSKSRAQLRRNGMRRHPSSRWFVRPEIVMETKLEEEAAKKSAREAAKDAAKEAKRKNKGSSLIHAVFAGSKNDSEP